VLLARSIQEARLFMDLHPCACGEAAVAGFTLDKRDGQLVAVYESDCPACGEPRRYEFAVPAETTRGAAFGGPEPSGLVDAGEFVWVSDRAAERALSLTGATDEPSRATARASIQVAIAALDEVFKFFPEFTRDSIPSDLGRAVYDANPDRFAPARLDRRRELLLDARSRLERSV
jgi:hypothetical protein